MNKTVVIKINGQVRRTLKDNEILCTNCSGYGFHFNIGYENEMSICKVCNFKGVVKII